MMCLPSIFKIPIEHEVSEFMFFNYVREKWKNEDFLHETHNNATTKFAQELNTRKKFQFRWGLFICVIWKFEIKCL